MADKVYTTDEIRKIIEPVARDYGMKKPENFILP